MASDVIPHDAWTTARARFLEDRYESERSKFADATLENIFYGASAAQKAHEAVSRTRHLAAKLDVLLAGINEWGKALDVYTNAAAMILAPLWGSLRVVIHVCWTP